MRYFRVIAGLLSVLLASACQVSSSNPTLINSIAPSFTQRFADDLVPYTTFTPNGICFSTDEQRAAFNTRGLPNALTNLLADPQTLFLPLRELEAIAAGGIELAERDIPTARDIPSQVVFIAEQDDHLLVNIRQRYCRYGSHDSPPWAIYVFDREGDFWELESGWIDSSTLQWVEDRWTYLANTSQTGQTNWVFMHAARTGDGWEGRAFRDIPYAPGLVWFNSKPNLTLAEGYRKLSVRGNHIGYSPPPCEWQAGVFNAIESRVEAMPKLDVMNTVYSGTLTYRWQDENYVLTDETAYDARVILTDYTYLKSTPPSAAELANDPYLRPQSWRGFCAD